MGANSGTYAGPVTSRYKIYVFEAQGADKWQFDTFMKMCRDLTVSTSDTVTMPVVW